MTDTRGLPLLAGADEVTVSELLDHPGNAHRTYKKGDYLTRQGAVCRSVYLLVAGALHATMAGADGKELVIERLTAPQLLAPAFVYGQRNRFPVSLTAVTDCELLVVGRDWFLDYMHRHPVVMANFIGEISDRCVFLSRKVNEFALQSLRARVTGYLREHGQIGNQQAVAARLGVARPSLARVLAELLREGIVRREGGAIVPA